MYPNGHLRDRQQRGDDHKELEKVQAENKILKRRLSRRYSSRNKGSKRSRLVVAEVLADDASDDDVDDSLLLLRIH
ncbi:hypothetical protein NECAME_05019 [Necator americanus]|uniref:Uncharacterized protein n=1 Tax=Necator americanus TaxID=51031 RepID=W2SKW5_NECAM|nr:hypothetical protein NECAME_05019 [Necator americanus]ETN70198.1 hypothetical protein NECAME_05019 [Necator americanus]